MLGRLLLFAAVPLALRAAARAVRAWDNYHHRWHYCSLRRRARLTALFWQTTRVHGEAAAAEAEQEAQALAELALPEDERTLVPLWGIDFAGTEGFEAPPEELATGELTPAIEQSAQARHCATGRELRAWLEGQGFEEMDSGAGPKGWDLGVSGTYEQIEALVAQLRAKLTRQEG